MKLDEFLASKPSRQARRNRNHLISQTEYDSLEWLVSPMVMTLPVHDITATEATSGLDLPGKSYYGGMELGVCWGMLHNPTVSGHHLACQQVADRVVMDGLLPNTTYYVRAYLTNTAKTTYGSEMMFTTLPSDSVMPLPEGVLPGLFSVSEGRQVRFSKGNLQYQASTGTWRFAEHQYDYVGRDNEKISETYHLISFNNVELGFNNNPISLADWQQVLEPAGAVFLPEAGVRTVDGVYPNLGYYQLSTTDVDKIYMLAYSQEHLAVAAGAHRGDGMAVRLVRDME